MSKLFRKNRNKQKTKGKSKTKKNKVDYTKFSDEKLKEEFTKLVNNMGVTEEKKNMLFNLPKKSQILLLEQQSEKITETPDQSLKEFNNNYSDKELRKLAVLLKNNDIPWVTKFVELGGPQIIFGKLNKELESGNKELLFRLIVVLNSLMNNWVGLSAVLELPNSLNSVCSVWNSKNPKTLSQVTQILAAVALVPDGYELVRDSIINYHKTEKRYPFSVPIKILVETKDYELKESCMILINALVTIEDTDIRIGTRFDFIDLGILEFFTAVDREIHEGLTRQIEIFESHMLDDNQEIMEYYGTAEYNIGSASKIIEKLEFKVNNSKLAGSFLKITRLIIFLLHKTSFKWEDVIDTLIDLLNDSATNHEISETFRELILPDQTGERENKLKKKVLDLTTEVRKLEDQIDELYKEKKGLRETIKKEFTNEIQKLKKEIQELKKEIENNKNEEIQIDDNNQNNENENKENIEKLILLEKDLNLKDSIIKDLKKEINKLKISNDNDNNKREIDNDKNIEKIIFLEEDLELKESKIKKLDKEIKEYKLKIENNNNSNNSETEKIKQQNIEKINLMKKDIELKDSNIGNLENQIKEYKLKIEKINNQNNNEIEAIKQQNLEKINLIKKDIELKDSNIGNLENQINSLESQIEKINNNNNNDINAQIQMIKEQHQEKIKLIKKDIELKNSNIENLENQIKEYKLKIEKINNQNNNEIEAIKQQNLEKINLIKKDIELKDSNIENLENQINGLQKKILNKDQLIKDNEKENEKQKLKTDEIENLKLLLKQRNQKILNLEKNNSELKNINTDLKKQHQEQEQKQKQEIIVNNNSSQSNNEESKIMNQKLQLLQKKFDKSENEKKMKIDQIRNLESQIEKLKSQMKNQSTNKTDETNNNEKSGSIPPPPNSGGGEKSSEVGGSIPPPPNMGGGIPPPPNMGGGGMPPPPNLGSGGMPPPPNLGSGGMPPPPNFGKGGLPSFGMSNSGKPKKKSVKPKIPMLNFHWDKVPDSKVDNSIWSKLTDDKIKIDVNEFMNEFKAKEKKSLTKGTSTTNSLDSNSQTMKKKDEKITFIDSGKTRNLMIVLSGLRMNHDEICKSILLLDEKRINGSQAKRLLGLLPTSEEIEQCNQYKNSITKMGECEKFYCSLIKIPNLTQRLTHFIFKTNFMESYNDAQNEVNNAIKATDQIKNNNKLHKLMEVILKLGNVMNGGTNKGGAYGFRFSTLPKLKNTKSSQNPKKTLLHYLIEVIQKKYPELLDWYKELTACEKASKISLPNTKKTLSTLDKGLKSLEMTLNTFEDSKLPNDKFIPIMSKFMRVNNQSFQNLFEKFNDFEKNFPKTLKYFGEINANQDIHEFMTPINTFIKLFTTGIKDLETWKRQAEIAKKSGKGRFANVVETMSKQGKVQGKTFGQKGVMDELLANMKNGGAFQLKKRTRVKTPTLKPNEIPQNWLAQLKKIPPKPVKK
ncbi:protein diaphanous [Anaeramoeba flamelloides]|uniref:Protein diaphanous n=1 Tax=Anaeramoeba flamelloides TaxID=1746091 RepID=A0ABQ8Y2P1_9EUKA|nr:protein diaphanous [Anaeramoeba flamelloides]